MFLSDYCNYQCWYCSKDFNSRSVKWPKLETILPNVLYLLDYYKRNGKTKFIIHIGGGEPSQWPDLTKFVEGIKKNYNCLVSLTTNGSRKLDWWKENASKFDHVGLSVHYEQADPEHLKNVGDIIYKSNTAMWASVLMDPNHWDQCEGIVNKLKKSKYKWSISSDQIHSDKVTYTPTQKEYLGKRIQRKNSIVYELLVNKRKRPKYFNPTIYYNNTNQTVPNHWLLLNGYDNFYGWECNVGVDTAFIDKNGDIKGSCGSKLYNKNFYYNIYDEDFRLKFNPNLDPVTCNMTKCHCQPEVNCTKQNKSNTHTRIIKLHSTNNIG